MRVSTHRVSLKHQRKASAGAECGLADVSQIHPTALPSTLNMPSADTENPVVSGLI